MAIQNLFFDPRLRVFAVSPYLYEVIAASASKSLYGLCLRGLTWETVGWLGRDERARLNSGSPRHSVASNSVPNEHVRAPLTVV